MADRRRRQIDAVHLALSELKRLHQLAQKTKGPKPKRGARTVTFKVEDDTAEPRTVTRSTTQDDSALG
jgi:hypothetical protein